MKKINFKEEFSKIKNYWRPRIVEEFNGQEIKIVKIKGAFKWHAHDDEEESFTCWSGRMRVETPEGAIDLEPGESVTVPAGMEHRTASDHGAEAIIIAPKGILTPAFN